MSLDRFLGPSCNNLRRVFALVVDSSPIAVSQLDIGVKIHTCTSSHLEEEIITIIFKVFRKVNEEIFPKSYLHATYSRLWLLKKQLNLLDRKDAQ